MFKRNYFLAFFSMCERVVLFPYPRVFLTLEAATKTQVIELRVRFMQAFGVFPLADV